MSLFSGACAIVAAIFALVTRRLEHMAVGLGVVGGAFAVDLVGRGATSAAVALTAGSALLVLIVLVALALVEVDARPVRRLQPWKLLLLVPLGGIAAQVGGLAHVARAEVASSRAAVGAILVVGLLALAAPLWLRRRQGGGS